MVKTLIPEIKGLHQIAYSLGYNINPVQKNDEPKGEENELFCFQIPQVDNRRSGSANMLCAGDFNVGMQWEQFKQWVFSGVHGAFEGQRSEGLLRGNCRK